MRRYVLYRWVGDRADDVVAETFLVAWRRLDDVPDDDPLPWLLAVARNVWLNQRRGDRRYAALLRRLPLRSFTPRPESPAGWVRYARLSARSARRTRRSSAWWPGMA